ncbi:MAG TPA: FAD-dependent oxidoreductase [Caldimonas sp.]|nr:FAD-dependent oxidoreductase [Caldimonas sp.]
MQAMGSIVSTDVVVIGAGIAGASLGHFLAPYRRTVLLERESQPGYHSTGRSAALFFESYGTPQVRALTLASRAFLDAPPAGFADGPILSPRGALLVAAPGEDAGLAEAWDVLRATSPRGELLDARAARALVPALREDSVLGAAYEPDAADIDVHRLHHGFLRSVRRSGGSIVGDAEVTAIARDERRGVWRVDAGSARYEAPVVVDAAGAWCDRVAALAGARPIGLVAKRRSIFTFAPPGDVESARWPLFGGLGDSWYVKPDAGMLLGSPANADPVEPQDVQPEELDIALAIDRIERATTLVVRPRRTWAGLRSFVADGDLVGGFADDAPGFFWLAAQGGYGIQTAAAMGEACAALVRGEPLPARIAAFGVTADALAPSRPSLRAAC